MYYCGGNSRGQLMRMMWFKCSPATKQIFLVPMNNRIGIVSCASQHSQDLIHYLLESIVKNSLLLCILGPFCVEKRSWTKRKIKKSQSQRKVFKFCKNNRLCTLLTQLSHFKFYIKFLKGLLEKNVTLIGAILDSWSNFGQKSKKGVEILAPSF